MKTALLKVCDDMLRALDNQEVLCLVFLDLSAAFDTMDCGIFLRHLESNFGITDTALAWIRSYLSDHSQKVVVGKVKSDPITLTFGVPQGSMLGLILFTLYTSPMGKICTRHGITYHLIADDQQIYLAFNPSKKGDQEDCVRRLENYIGEIRMWMSTNMLKLNDDKTEFTIFGTRQQLTKVQEITLVTPEYNQWRVCQELGLLMDSLLKNDIHINKLTSSLYCHLQNIHKIRGKLDFKSAKPSHKPLFSLRLTTATPFSWRPLHTNLTRYSASKTWHVEWFSNLAV